MPDPADGFQAIHDAFRPKVLRYLQRLVGPSDAEDLAQVVMLKASLNLPRFRGESDLSTWIYRIATNTALDGLRSRSHREAAEAPYSAGAIGRSGDDPDDDHGRPEASGPSVETVAIRQEMNDCIREFIGGLPENYRTVLLLSDIEGFKNSEIADILGVSVDVVKIRLHRAREKLRQALSQGCSFYRDDEGNEFACDRKPSSAPDPQSATDS